MNVEIVETIVHDHDNTDGIYESDADNHWKVCDDCGNPYDVEAHIESEWIIDTETTSNKPGEKHKECTVCGYIITTETLPATGTNIIFPKLFEVKVIVGEGGSTNVSKTFVIAYGASRTIKITPDEGYEVADILVNNKSVGASEKYSIRGAHMNYTVEVIFAKISD